MVDFQSVDFALKQHRAEAPAVPKGAISPPPPTSALEFASVPRGDFGKLLGTACFTGSVLLLGAIVVGLIN
jgi:hypothetical protein